MSGPNKNDIEFIAAILPSKDPRFDKLIGALAKTLQKLGNELEERGKEKKIAPPSPSNPQLP